MRLGYSNGLRPMREYKVEAYCQRCNTLFYAKKRGAIYCVKCRPDAKREVNREGWLKKKDQVEDPDTPKPKREVTFYRAKSLADAEAIGGHKKPTRDEELTGNAAAKNYGEV